MTIVTTKTESLPTTIRPMLARLGREPFDSPEYLYELKWDGIRALAFIEGERLRLLSRTSRDITAHFPELAALPGQVKADKVILDGELVCLDDQGYPSFSKLQLRLEKTDTGSVQRNPIHFVAFDVLYLQGQSVMRGPLLQRKELLRQILTPSESAQPCEFIENDGIAFFQATCEYGLEGIIAKEKTSLYFPGKRSHYWLKIKRVRESEFVIGGYTFGGKKKELFGSLLLGLYDNDKQLVYVGQVGAGFSDEEAKRLYSVLQLLHTVECPFEVVPSIQRFIYWCRPQLVCQIEYGEFSEEGVLRYPVFKTLREDKSPAECIIADALGWPRALADFA